MNKERIIRELTPIFISAIGLWAISLFAFTEKQKKEIRERDGGCMFPEKHPCNGKQKTLHVHHIIPQRYARAVGIENPDFEENGISLCEYAHQRLIHPDMAEALQAYRAGDKQAFKKAFEKREEILSERKTYWNTTWDRQLHTIAVRNTQRHHGTVR